MKFSERANKLGDYLSSYFFNIMLGIIATLNVLPILAPILARLGWYWPAKIIYFIYSFFCHQLHWRSMHVCDHQYGWCARCTGLWFNVLLTGILVKFFKVKTVKWYWIAILLVPMALDGVVQTIATIMGFTSASEIYYMSNSLVRMITGSLFGIGFGLWVWTNLADNLSEKEQAKRKKPLSALKIFFICLLVTAVFYTLAMLLWQLTSPINGPVNFFDFAAKTPILPQDFLIRGKDTI